MKKAAQELVQFLHTRPHPWNMIGLRPSECDFSSTHNGITKYRPPLYIVRDKEVVYFSVDPVKRKYNARAGNALGGPRAFEIDAGRVWSPATQTC